MIHTWEHHENGKTWDCFTYVKEKAARKFMEKLQKMGYSPFLTEENGKWIVRKQWGVYTKPEPKPASECVPVNASS